jgi:Spy/CpxP family protein refolding chaperone
MKRSLLAAALLLVAASCSSDSDQPPQAQPGRGGYGGGMASAARPRAAVTSGLELLPPADWWKDEEIARAVNLTGDQTAQLDKISADQKDEIAKLERDGMVAIRDLRSALELAQPTTDDLTSAGHRVRDIRGSLLDHQVQLLASERLVLTQQQWSSLQDKLQEERRDNIRDRGNRPGGRGRGGFGGGRRPFPG